MKRKRRKWFYSRKLVQLGAMGLLFLPLYMANPIWIGTYVSSEFFSLSLTDPLAALEVILAGKMIWVPLLLSALPLILTAFILGRVFCSWICPVNTLIEIFTEAVSIFKKTGEAPRPNGYTPYLVLLIVLTMSALISLPVFTIISPIGSVSRAIAFGVSIELALVGLIILGELFWERKAWCRIICPVGALYGFIGRLRFLNIAIDRKNCSDCNQCRTVCSMGVDVGSDKSLDVMNCTNCADCLDVCAKGAVNFNWKFKPKGGNTSNDYESF